MLEDGRVIIIATSDPSYDHLHPFDSNIVRADTHYAGYILKATEHGALVKHVVNVSLSFV